MNYLKQNKIEKVTAAYIKTLKNEQVNNLYDNCSFSLIESNKDSKKYELVIENYKSKSINYIEISNGK